MYSKINLFVFVLLIFGLVGCRKNIFDSQAPAVFLNLPVNNSTFFTNQVIPIQGVFTDNNKLSSFYLAIQGDSFGENWDTTFNNSNGLTGQNSELNMAINLNNTIPNGSYKLILYCVDNLENQSDTTSLNLNIRNFTDTIAPVLHLISPLPNDNNEVTPLSSNIAYIVSLNDNNLLDTLLLQIKKIINDSLVLDTTCATAVGLGSTTLIFVVPTPIDTGLYNSTLIFKDKVNNQSVINQHIRVN